MGQQKNPEITTVRLYRETLSKVMQIAKYGSWDERINYLIDQIEQQKQKAGETKTDEANL